MGVRVTALLLVIPLAMAGCAKSGEDDGGDGTGGDTQSGSVTNTTTPGNNSTGTTGDTGTTSTSNSSTSTTPRPAQTFQRDVLDNSFPQGSFTLQKGDTVVWTHKGTNPHSVSTTSGSAESFDSHPNCPPVCMLASQTYTHAFNTLGNVTYHCKVHSGMTGTIEVVAALAA